MRVIESCPLTLRPIEVELTEDEGLLTQLFEDLLNHGLSQSDALIHMHRDFRRMSRSFDPEVAQIGRKGQALTPAFCDWLLD